MKIQLQTYREKVAGGVTTEAASKTKVTQTLTRLVGDGPLNTSLRN